jgi:hypothetical protein
MQDYYTAMTISCSKSFAICERVPQSSELDIIPTTSVAQFHRAPTPFRVTDVTYHKRPRFLLFLKYSKFLHMVLGGKCDAFPALANTLKREAQACPGQRLQL